MYFGYYLSYIYQIKSITIFDSICCTLCQNMNKTKHTIKLFSSIISLCLLLSCSKPKENNTQTKPSTTETTQITITATKQQAFSLQLQANGTIKALFSTYIHNKLAKTQEMKPRPKIPARKFAS